MLGERKTRGVFNEGKNSEWGSRMQELIQQRMAAIFADTLRKILLPKEYINE